MEFKGTKGRWVVSFNNFENIKSVTPSINCHEIEGLDYVCLVYGDIDDLESKANALLISKAPEMLEMLKKARIELSMIRRSMMAHPDCMAGSEFDDYTTSAQTCENKIDQLIKEATKIK